MSAKKKSKRTPPPSRRAQQTRKKIPRTTWFYLSLLLAVVLFGFVANDSAYEPRAPKNMGDISNPGGFGTWFTQDDAYISYRYARNALDGEGLVFNPGERVEGYTNFFWVIWLMAAGSLGVSFDLAAKLLGVASALGLIILAAVLTREALERLRFRHSSIAGFLAAVLVAANGSMAYWSFSGLETSWFGLCVAADLYWWLRRSPMVVVALAVATMTRPEGGLVWLVLTVAEWFVSRDWKRTVFLFGSVALLLVPLALFKLIYYGSLLPNPFYAKTGFSTEYWVSGLDYVWQFIATYGLWGLGPLAVALGAIVLRGRLRILPILWMLYTIYIASVGGDVLRPNRFFVPILVPMAVSIVAVFAWLAERIASVRWRPLIPAIGVIALAVWGFITPRSMIIKTRDLELGLLNKMTFLARELRTTDPRPFTIAASTIGKIAFDLPGCRVIDMLGLTDSTIARHPESIPKNESTWRERNYNATYVLEQKPDYILFSTGHKPSAPAERALVLHSNYRRNYRTILFSYTDRSLAVHKRRINAVDSDTVWPDIQLAHDINMSFNYQLRGDYDSALAVLDRLMEDGPGDFSLPAAFAANVKMSQRQLGQAIKYADQALAIDSQDLIAWQAKGRCAEIMGDTTEAVNAYTHMADICPWLAHPLLRQ